MSVWVTLDMTAAAGAWPRLEAFLDEKLPAVRGFRGALSVRCHRSGDRLLIVEEWRSRDDHAAYLATIAENGVMQALASHLTGPPDIAYFERLPI